ncbi:MAG: MATE family efflux transporter [Rhodospirillales bacterium]|nr:MATE family efflux transporter [Rhodospirillales bacterium]MBO6786038.1 MATE family efflux transporter [Rhodospirillales bacterium]
MFDQDAKYWHRRTWRIALPVIVTNVSVPILGIVDTAVVGRLPGPEFVGAVAIGALIFNLLYHGCNFLRMGTTGLTAQSFGARDGREVRTWLVRALMLGIVIGVAMVILQWPIFEISALTVGPSESVLPLTREYFEVRIWSAPAALANFALLGWFFGVQNTRAALITQIYMNGINAILDFWFVLGLGWGVAGVAWATVIGETTAVILGLALAGQHLRRMGGHFDGAQIMQAGPFKRMLGVNRDIFIRSMCLQSVFVILTALGARMGDSVLAANAILLHLQVLTAYALDGFSNAAEALAGEAKGARNRRNFAAAIRTTVFWSFLLAVVFSGLTATLGPYMIDALTIVESVRETARTYLIWSILLPLVSVWSFQLDGIFIGCTWSREMRNAMIVSLLVYLAALPVLVPPFANHGLWGAFMVLMAARAVTLGWMLPGLQRKI